MSCCALSFVYPSDWHVPVNPAHERAREDTEQWMRDLGLLASEDARRTFAAMNVGWYGGSPFPAAGFEELSTITRFLTLWIFHDDVLEGLGAEAAAVLGAAVRGEPEARPETGPYVRGWRELGRRFRRAMSAEWLSRFSGRFVDWLASVDAEARLADRAKASGQPPSFREYMAVREVNIGVLPTVCWIEYAQGVELPPAVLGDPDLALAERLAGRLVTFQNDAIGLEKDARRGWPNAVLSIAADLGVSLREAIARVEELHAEDVAALAETCERLSRRHGDAARAWARELCRMVAGFARWHLGTPRYTGAGAAPVSLAA